jgi:hypothetical protein
MKSGRRGNLQDYLNTLIEVAAPFSAGLRPQWLAMTLICLFDFLVFSTFSFAP